MPKPIDDTLMLDNMAEDILQGRAHTPTGAMRLHGVEDGSADERRLLRKWKDGGGIKAMEWAAHLILTATVERHREELSQHGFREYERGYKDAYDRGLKDGIANGKSLERQRREAEPVSWWERITSRRAKVVE